MFNSQNTRRKLDNHDRVAKEIASLFALSRQLFINKVKSYIMNGKNMRKIRELEDNVERMYDSDSYNSYRELVREINKLKDDNTLLEHMRSYLNHSNSVMHIAKQKTYLKIHMCVRNIIQTIVWLRDLADADDSEENEKWYQRQSDIATKAFERDAFFLTRKITAWQWKEYTDRVRTAIFPYRMNFIRKHPHVKAMANKQASKLQSVMRGYLVRKQLRHMQRSKQQRTQPLMQAHGNVMRELLLIPPGGPSGRQHSFVGGREYRVIAKKWLHNQRR